jgi:hypothetical protein
VLESSAAVRTAAPACPAAHPSSTSVTSWNILAEKLLVAVTVIDPGAEA